MVRVTVEAVAGLVADLYEGAYDDSKWAQALDALRRPFDSPSIVFSVENEIDRSSEIVSVNTDPYWDRLYVEEFFEHNVLWRPMAAMAPGTVAADWSLLPREEFRKTYIFNEFLAHLDSNSMLCCKILGRGSTSSFLALAHGVRQPEFDTDHIELMTALMPTLIRVTTLRDRIGALNLPTHTAAAALDALSVGIAVVGHNGRVIHANQSAQGLLAQRDGTVTVGPMGLTARVPEAATALRHLINQTVSGASEQGNGYLLLPSPQPTGPALSVYVGPLPEPGIYGLPDGPCAIVFMRPMETDANLEQQVRHLFGLTDAEARMAAGMAAGLSPTEIATLQGVRISTVRTHLSRIFQKTQTRQQAHLVALLKGIALPGPRPMDRGRKQDGTEPLARSAA